MALTPTARKVALVALKSLRARDYAYEEYRADQYALPVGQRDSEWHSYCIHGSYVGDPYGADYMCHLCESGITVYEEALEAARAGERQWEAIVSLIPSLQRAERLGAIPSADAALSAAIDGWTRRYLGIDS